MQGITEKQFCSQLEDLFKLFGWSYYHVVEQYRYARRTTRGFPDYVAVRIPRLIFAEVKSETGKLTPDQEKWLDALRKVADKDVEVYVWRPENFEAIMEILR